MERSYEDEYLEIERSNPWFVARRELVAFFLRDVPTHVRILDVGCGSGFFMQYLRQRGYQHTSGIEFSAEFLKAENAAVGNGEHLPLKDCLFDVVFCLDILEHVDRDDVMAHELWRVLKPGGLLVVTVPALMLLWSHHDTLNQHKRRYDSAMLRRCLKGFVVRKMSYWNFFLFLPILCMKYVKRKGAVSSDFVPLPAPLRAIALTLFRIENWLVRRVRLPWGVSIVAVVTKPQTLDAKV